MEARAIAVILAAGEGKRMKSILPKVLHQLAGRPLIEHVVQTSFKAGMVQTIVVVGHRRDMVISALDAYPVEFVVQNPQRGTGHAMQQVVKYLGNYGGTLAVLLGDAPFVSAKTLQAMITEHQTDGNAITMLSAELDDPAGYGRIVRGADGSLEKIVEDSDASEEELAIREINSGIGCFRYEPLCRAIGALDTKNEQQEYYLTDTIEILRGEGLRLGARMAEDSLETWGINDFPQLRAAERIWREREAAAAGPEGDAGEGVTDEPETSYGDSEVSESGLYDQVYHAGPDEPAAPTEPTGGEGTPAMTVGYRPLDTTPGDESSTAPGEV